MPEEVLLIDGFTEIKMGKRQAIRFNVLFGGGSEENSLYVALPGFRLVDGRIFPPASLSGGRWYQVVVCGEDFATRLYGALALKLRAKGMLDDFPMNDVRDAVVPLIDRLKVLRDFPEEMKDCL